MINGRASALMDQNNALPALQKLDTRQFGKRHLAVDW
jgi:hypothetical protein